jgi:hypothetical protein
MPEPGLAYGLYYQVSQNAQYAQKALEFALSPQRDLRQSALVLDWCAAALTAPDLARLTLKVKNLLAGTSVQGVRAQRDRVLAAAALASAEPALSAATLRATVESWWRQSIAPGLDRQPSRIPRADLLALLELLHVLRDNLNIDLRSDAVDYFKNLVQYQLLTYYPAPYPAVENEYRIPLLAGRPSAEPDLREAAASRIAELAMIAYDNNAQEMQFLQGWLMNDKFTLKATFGAPYEFLWANPYQPGLTYFLLPLFYHDPVTGQLFFRSSWQEDAEWFGLSGGKMQLFRNGEITPLSLAQLTEPLRLGPLQLHRATLPFSLRLPAEEGAATHFLLGLKPETRVRVEVDDEEMIELSSDAAGTVKIELDPRPNLTFLVRPA